MDSNHNKPQPDDLPPGAVLRDHSYDGIEEYDQRLPNWWLWTFYLAMIFTGIYWIGWYHSRVEVPDPERINAAMAAVEAANLEKSLALLNDFTLMDLAANADYVSAGKEIYTANCVACHLASLRGNDEGGIGESLVDNNWLYGDRPVDVYKIINEGSPNKQSGMVAWGGQLGAKRVAQVTAYVLSYHDPASLSMIDE